MPESLELNRYLAEVHTALAGLPAGERDDAVAELEANLLADIGRRGGNEAAEHAAIADLGSPAEYAAAVREAFGRETVSPQPQGRILGMPFEFRTPTASTVMDRIWNPSDPRIFMPRTFGVGWTINFGAIAVRLGWIRPDDVEERPLENLSDAAISVAVTLPVLVGVVVAGVVLAFWSRMPETIPVHFDAAGAADGWGSKAVTLGILVAVALGAPVAAYLWAWRSRASRGTFAIVATLSMFFGVLAATIVGYTVANVVYGVEGWWLGLLVLLCVLVPGVMFYVLARASLKKEWSAAPAAPERERESK